MHIGMSRYIFFICHSKLEMEWRKEWHIEDNCKYVVVDLLTRKYTNISGNVASIVNGELTSWLADRLAGCLVGWFAVFVDSWLADLLTCWLTCWPADWLAAWLSRCPAGGLDDRLAGWLKKNLHAGLLWLLPWELGGALVLFIIIFCIIYWVI